MELPLISEDCEENVELCGTLWKCVELSGTLWNFVKLSLISDDCEQNQERFETLREFPNKKWNSLQHWHSRAFGNGFMSNSPHLLDALHKRCFGRRGLCSRPSGGMHQNCLGTIARRAAIISDTMCEMILSGFSVQMKADRRMRGNKVGVNHVMLDGSEGTMPL